jgi:hypothetical protein
MEWQGAAATCGTSRGDRLEANTVWPRPSSCSLCCIQLQRGQSFCRGHVWESPPFSAFAFAEAGVSRRSWCAHLPLLLHLDCSSFHAVIAVPCLPCRVRTAADAFGIYKLQITSTATTTTKNSLQTVCSVPLLASCMLRSHEQNGTWCNTRGQCTSDVQM